jgi:hypothetical protein
MDTTGQWESHNAGVINDDDNNGERAEKIETGLAFASLKPRINSEPEWRSELSTASLRPEWRCGLRRGFVNAAQRKHRNADVDLSPRNDFAITPKFTGFVLWRIGDEPGERIIGLRSRELGAG